jgi:hypothetical protein
MRRKLVTYFAFPTTTTSVVIILSIIIITVLDSTIFKFASYAELYLPILLHVNIFLVFSVIFSLICITLINMAKKNSEFYLTFGINMKYFHWLCYICQIIILCIILIINLQMIFSNLYNVILLTIGIYLVYITTLIFLISLNFIFARWLKSKRNYLIILFMISFSLLGINIIISIIHLDSYFMRAISINSDRKQHSVTTIVTDFPFLSIKQNTISLYNIISILSFAFMWLSTVVLLSPYRFRLGKIKYFFLIAIPLIYYLSPFEPYLEDRLLSLIIESPALSATFYVVLLNISKQIGALFFSIYFLIASNLIAANKVRQSMLISGIGMVIVFGSLEIQTLQYILYPPYGLITAAFMPVGSYLLFIGIFSSAQSISRHIEIRKELFTSTKNELAFLKDIGEAEQVQELLNKCRHIAKRTTISTNQENTELDQKEAMEIIHDVMDELKIIKEREKDHGKKET